MLDRAIYLWLDAVTRIIGPFLDYCLAPPPSSGGDVKTRGALVVVEFAGWILRRIVVLVKNVINQVILMVLYTATFGQHERINNYLMLVSDLPYTCIYRCIRGEVDV